MLRFTIYSFLFKPINEPYQKDAFAPEVDAEESMKNKLQLFGDLLLPQNDFKFLFHRVYGECPRTQHHHLQVFAPLHDVASRMDVEQEPEETLRFVERR